MTVKEELNDELTVEESKMCVDRLVTIYVSRMNMDTFF
jgi:hypothetical protein